LPAIDPGPTISFERSKFLTGDQNNPLLARQT
jgi:hypothetical protein